MDKNQVTKIQINDTTFSLDLRYDFVMDLVSSEFETESLILDQLFGRDNEAAKALVKAILQYGCEHDIAMSYFIAMMLQNYGELEKAGKILTRIYRKNPSDLLAQCAYANHLIFHESFDKIPAVFNNTFDLEKICTERELPLVTFAHFMGIVCTYYMAKNDPRNFSKYFAYMVEGAPEHGETQRFIQLLSEPPARA